MNNQRRIGGVFLGILILIILVSLFAIFGLVEKIINAANTPDEPLYSYDDEDRIEYKGEWYELNDSIESILVLGIDSIQDPSEGKADSRQADFVALIVIDKEKHTYSILHINRDTMTQITQLDKYGEKYGEYTAQLALSHGYGGTDQIRCRNTVHAVENILYGIDITHYLSLTMDAVAILNDSLGGITVKLANDYPALGEEYVKDAEITLHGDAALSFVRWRNSEAETSNLERMERQRQYIGALFEKYTEFDPENTFETMMKVNEYLVSDCTVNQLSTLIERLQGYEYEGTATLKGETTKPDVYVEYYIDEDAAKQTVIDLFYLREEVN